MLVLEEKIAMKDKSLEDVKSELNQIEFRHHQQIELILAEVILILNMFHKSAK